MKRFAFLLPLLLALIGCDQFQPLPTIPHHHWKRRVCGAELCKDDNGIVVASWCGEQVCIYDPYTGPCEDFDSYDKALQYIKEQYK